MFYTNTLTDCFKSPLTQTYRFSEVLPPYYSDRVLSFLDGNSNLFWQGKSEQEQDFIKKIKARSSQLWCAAAKLNPKFSEVPLDIEVLFGQRSINAFTTGYGKVRITKDLIRAVLAEKDLSYKQQLDVMSSIIAHEMGHCLQRHICRNVCTNLLLTTIDLLSQYCYPIGVIAEMVVELWTLITFDYFSRGSEREADITGVLILDSYNAGLPKEDTQNNASLPKEDSHTIDLDIVPHIWTHFKTFVHNPPKLLQLFSSHPASEERAQLTAKMAWILKHNRDVLTCEAKRRAFFEETRAVNNIAFLTDWNLPISELADVMRQGSTPLALTPAMQTNNTSAWIQA